MLEVKGIGDLTDLVRIAAQNLDLVTLLANVIAVREQVRSGCGCAAGAVLRERDDHGSGSWLSPGAGRSAARACSIALS